MPTITEALLSWLPRFFQKDPLPYLALRLNRFGTWRIASRTLTVTPGPDNPGAPTRTYDLAAFTVAGLANQLSADGYDPLLEAGPDQGLLSALVLLDGEGDLSTSNGNALYAWSNLLFAYLMPMAAELDQAQVQIGNMLLQMETQTAEGEWLDFIGSYYGVPRKVGEADRPYGERIIVEVLRPRANNNAIALAIEEATGQPTEVIDVNAWGNVIPAHNSFYSHNSAITHNSTANPIYGLFDVETAFDLLGTVTPDAYQAVVAELVSRMRDAGTHLREVRLSGGAITDDGPPGALADDFASLAANATLDDPGPAGADEGTAQQLAVTLVAPLDDAGPGQSDASGLALTYSQTTTFNGARTFSGGIPWSSGVGGVETL